MGEKDYNRRDKEATEQEIGLPARVRHHCAVLERLLEMSDTYRRKRARTHEHTLNGCHTDTLYCYSKWVAPCENVSSGICGQGRPRLFTMNEVGKASTQSDQGIHGPLTESLDTTKCINEEQIDTLRMRRMI